MSMYLPHLDARTRRLMHDEVQADIARGTLYFSRRSQMPAF